MNTICKPPSNSGKNLTFSYAMFNVVYKDETGTTLHGSVKKITENDYEVFIKEKAAIIHCTLDSNRLLSCRLNSLRNPPWVDQICREVAKKIKEKGEE